MTKLLVSVRDVEEAEIALAGGADLIDVKEPRRGSLGAADAATIERIVQRCSRYVPISAALGELEQENRQPVTSGLSFAKIGLAGCSKTVDWQARWQSAIADWPRGIRPVAVIYADWKTACAPSPVDVLGAAASVGCAAMLIDTFDKSHGDLLAHMSVEDLAPLVARARAMKMLIVLAGSLRAPAIERVLPLEPDYIAVRSAACRGERTGRIDLRRVKQLSRLIGPRLEPTTRLTKKILDNSRGGRNTRRSGPNHSWQQQEECRAEFGGRGDP